MIVTFLYIKVSFLNLLIKRKERILMKVYDNETISKKKRIKIKNPKL